MNVTKKVGFYIDDDLQGATALAKRLDTDWISLTVMAPNDLMTMTDRILESHPHLLILDYRLDQNKGENGLAASYRAGPVAQHFRDKSGQVPERDFPIVLLSSEDKLRDYYEPEKTAHDLFDWRLLKGQVAKDGTPERQVLSGLVDGYEMLRKHSVNFSASRTSIFGIDGADSDLIEYQELDDVLIDSQSPHILARYIIKYVIRRNGILQDWYLTRAKLGVHEIEEKSEETLKNWLDSLGTSYTGTFSGCEKRWWAARIDNRLNDFFGGPFVQMSAAERVSALNKKLGLTMAPAVDRWSGSADYSPTFSCASCSNPTPLRHSLSCLDIGLPSFVLRRRVCWSCVQTDQYLDMKLRIDAKDMSVAAKLRTNEIRSEPR